jgi:hypothetical protein
VSGQFPQYHAWLIKTSDERWVESAGSPIRGSLPIIRTLEAAGIPLCWLIIRRKKNFGFFWKNIRFLNISDG